MHTHSTRSLSSCDYDDDDDDDDEVVVETPCDGMECHEIPF